MANKKDLEELEDLAEFRMRSFRIMLHFLGAGSPASRSYASERAVAPPRKRDSHDRWSLTSSMELLVLLCH